MESPFGDPAAEGRHRRCQAQRIRARRPLPPDRHWYRQVRLPVRSASQHLGGGQGLVL